MSKIHVNIGVRDYIRNALYLCLPLSFSHYEISLVRWLHYHFKTIKWGRGLQDKNESCKPFPTLPKLSVPVLFLCSQSFTHVFKVSFLITINFLPFSDQVKILFSCAKYSDFKEATFCKPDWALSSRPFFCKWKLLSPLYDVKMSKSTKIRMVSI